MSSAPKHTKRPQPLAVDAPRCRHRVVLDTAERAGLLKGEKGRIAGWVRAELIRAGKERSGRTSNTQLLEYALAKVALEDNFCSKIRVRKGRVSTKQGNLDRQEVGTRT
ncbi:hypothetical protein JKG68_30820 [Microvirga aerilata]|uniref:Uncharacterized protein n=1 Tax=Microvirga aerilata TaxID=670292 RepID=A0A936ZCF1_9HYPH|nr:hypothetical protein [Microvirga aerilata]MBL0408276.1 hypothetical protein [Microvirga aerilata]